MEDNKIVQSGEFPRLNSKEGSRLKNSKGGKFSGASFMQTCASIATTAFGYMYTVTAGFKALCVIVAFEIFLAAIYRFEMSQNEGLL